MISHESLDMKLFYSPGACSIGIHFLLEEIGKPYEVQRIRVKEGEQFHKDYVALTPKSKVPLLQRDDGSLVTEFPVIAYWLAKTNPSLNLIGGDLEHEIRALEIMDYAVSTIHMQGFSRQFRPMKFAPSESDHDTVIATGRDIAMKAFQNVSSILGDKSFVLGDHLTIADCALFYVLFWACDRANLDVPENCAAYYARLRARPSAQEVFAKEEIVFS